jgi:predicted kinase
MNKFIMLIGLPGSGKSTAADEWISNCYVWHSSDCIREELFGDTNSQIDNQLVFKTLHERVREDLLAGKDVVYDATNLSMKRRRGFIRQWLNGIECKKTAVVMATPYNECVQRDHDRERTVGAGVLDRMYKSFNFPLLQEGFDDIEIRYSSDSYEEFDYVTHGEFLDTVKQHNENHKLTIGDHCLKVAQNLREVKASKELRLAGLLHDFGKLKTMSFVNSKGQYSNKAHYYSHENVSAYDAMFYIQKEDVDVQKVCQFINYHMRPHALKTEKSINKFKNFVGDEFWGDIMILHNADVNSRE